MKASDLFVKSLEAEGVEYVFGIPGEENLDLLESLRRSKIKLVLTRHEQAAGFMAATYGRLTGRAGVCLTTLGPGALNLTTAAAYAHLGAMPMVMLTGQKAIRSSRQARFQIVDIVATMRPLTKMATQIVSAQSVPTLVRDAFRVAHHFVVRGGRIVGDRTPVRPRCELRARCLSAAHGLQLHRPLRFHADGHCCRPAPHRKYPRSRRAARDVTRQRRRPRLR